MSEELPKNDIVSLSSAKYVAGCAAAAAFVYFVGRSHPFPAWLIAVEVLVTVVALFVFGSIRYRLDKNALTYGAALVIVATFWQSWWQQTPLRSAVAAEGGGAIAAFLKRHLFSLRGLDALVHADTMLFILGLTFFVAAIAQTRILETMSLAILKKKNGAVVPTIALLAAIVSLSSGILDGVSMIGLMIRTLVIVLVLAQAKDGAIVYAVVISTVVTTVCGMWLAYGEPPNLIMKSNLTPHLTDAFFLRYCLPIAIGAYFIVLWNIRRALRGRRVDLTKLDDFAQTIDRPYAVDNAAPAEIHRRRVQTQWVAGVSFAPFIGLLVWHAIDHDVPLFLASFAGFAVAFLGIARFPHMRRLALREARHEYAEYLFLFPLFFSITLLQQTGFFQQLADLLRHGVDRWGVTPLAYAQFAATTLLSAMLDNNVVADFAGRAIRGLEVGVLHLFAMAQIAGYAVGGCWTHIGSAQSVVAYSFIRKDVDKHFTPFQWIKAMTPIVLEISMWAIVVIGVGGWLS